MICLWRVMYVWHKSICQCSQDIVATLIARNTHHGRLTWGYIVNSQHGSCGMVVSCCLIVISRSNIAHFVLTFFFVGFNC
jgi:hypothetical protein